MARRSFLDLSTLARWTGPPAGMVRVEHELWMASRDDPAIEPVFYDPATSCFRAFAPGWRDVILSWTGAIDGWGTDYHVSRRGWRRFIPSRYPMMRALERRRITTRSPVVRGLYDRLQRLILGVRPHRYPFRVADGARIALVPRDLALAGPAALTPGDVILSPASDWLHKNPEDVARIRQTRRIRYVTVCYDIIPLLAPHRFPAADVSAFSAYWHRTFQIADLVIVNSRTVRTDIERFCDQNGDPRPALAVVPLAPLPPRPVGRLPDGLTPNRYALFVSTIEPRKNHRLLLDAWRALLRAGIPQAAGFTLVFVGRAGWMVDDVLADIASADWQGTMQHLQGIADDTLEALYRNAAFCLYPSFYEGFGLPVIEAAQRGTPTLCSTGGALAEFAHLGKCLPPDEIDRWIEAIGAWIRTPPARLDQSGLMLPVWREVARDMLAAARGLSHSDRHIV